MKAPRSPRMLRLLSSLESIYSDGNASPAERLRAAELASNILSGKRKTATTRKNKTPKPVKPAEPASKGSDLVPARATPADILRQFPQLAPVRPV